MSWVQDESGIPRIVCDVCGRSQWSRYDSMRAVPGGWELAVGGGHWCPVCVVRLAPPRRGRPPLPGQASLFE